MSKTMLIDAAHPEETRVAIVDGRQIEEFDFESRAKRQLRGNIYLAKVTRVEPSLQAAFVEYGGNRHGFLAFSEIHPDYYQIPKEDREALLRERYRGGQSFYVCPRIEDLAGAKDFFDKTVPEVKVAVAHGQMPATALEDIMSAFYDGKFDVLLSTTIIESGLDIPNANTLIVERGDNFGLSQLHQLRGRVGRGGLPGRCFLRTSAGDSSPSMERLRAVAASNDGFELARVDLMTRREGDVLGAVQSGEASSLRFLSLVEDADVIDDARGLATEVVHADLTLADHRPLADLVDAVMGPSRISYLDKS